MVLCTCKYCLCCLNAVVVLDTILLVLLIVTYLIFGSMPPSYTMAIGFWLLVWTNFFAIYFDLLAESTFQRNHDIRWINLLTYYGIIGCAVCYLIGAILFYIPLTANSMMSYSKTYWKLYKEIPPFLDHIQMTYKCCGIYNYTDYGKKDFYRDSYGEKGFLVIRYPNPEDDFLQELIPDTARNRTFLRTTTGFDVPHSCCVTHKALNPYLRNCGEKVEYTNSVNKQLQSKQKQSAIEKINDPNMGCFEKYKNVMEEHFWRSGALLQLPFLISIIRIGALIQCTLCLVLLWIHKLAIKSIRQVSYWLPELMSLHKNEDMAKVHANLEAEAEEELTVAEMRKKTLRRAHQRSLQYENARRTLLRKTRNTEMYQRLRSRSVRNN